ncbi:hypothetical protein UVI_02028040 [Ustilaginoidea virens]|uniref:SET domain-containing protein n=1 Tax=Ustilaginoidea virens TaxID=1159556 RepID=A0A1B5KVE7_USTVR|nr:hypothetical protein UVI_02028040 [Ustilaginoidea virens]
MPAQLPIDAFPAWAHVNNVCFQNVILKEVGDEKGVGLLAESQFKSVSKQSSSEKTSVLLQVPHDLVLSAEAVDGYAKVDGNFKQLLEVAGGLTALKAKFIRLADEFGQLREKSMGLAFWNALFWKDETVSLEDWILADAWYRSRCLELPRSGTSMVPGLDMVNHSGLPAAYYDENTKDEVLLAVRPGTSLAAGEEVTISYGDAKPASEMLFSYGFIDSANAVYKLSLPLDPLPDDPLAKAKLHVFGESPLVTLSLATEEGKGGEPGLATWYSPFVYLMCLNEEDGLSFQLLQDVSGGRELRLLWQDADVTDRVHDFENLIRGHPLCKVFELRAVSALHQTVEEQLVRADRGPSDAELEALQQAGVLRSERVAAAQTLKEVERKVMASAVRTLEREVCILSSGHCPMIDSSFSYAYSER